VSNEAVRKSRLVTLLLQQTSAWSTHIGDISGTLDAFLPFAPPLDQNQMDCSWFASREFILLTRCSERGLALLVEVVHEARVIAADHTRREIGLGAAEIATVTVDRLDHL
jgi:hypothetical protein